MSLDTLPPELYECILGHVPPLELQQTILSITRAIPLSPVPISQLFHSIRITHPLQAIHLYRRLRPRSTKELDADGKRSSSSSPETAWVKEVFIEAWSVDANVIVNLLRLLPEIKLLSIWIGPENFAPEHLEELFQKPLSELTFLSLRFRPYVQKATYYQFLKGAYFDSTLLALSRWPSSTLPTISIVQDPLDPNILQKQTFAQPLVFFRLDSCISSLLHSPALAPSLTSLRLRIPSRPIARSLSVITAHGSPSDLVKPANIEFLDISTSVVLETELDTLLARLTSLKHIILDGCAILRGDLYEVEWNALGKRCALVGVRRAKEREKALKTWLEERSTATGGGSAQVIARPKPKPGRKGLSTATISFRDPDPITAPPTSTLNTLKVRVLPPLPTLLSLSTTLSPAIQVDKYPAIRAAFEAGWAEGIVQLSVTRARLRTSAGNGFRVMRLASAAETSADDAEYEDGLEGLVDVDNTDPEAFGMIGEDGSVLDLKVPVLCFSGAKRDADIKHEDNCGHSVGWKVMGDEM
ncbi:hypothetical protein B0H34DRAFT_644878 [Crassisporium funariophilum]|nr:hypothetical protein B0H34DRAFT_644878 [Crassisporium funariophilum]